MKNINLNLVVLFGGILLLFSCRPIASSEAPDRLHDIWGLKELDGKKINPAAGAVLELNIAQKQFLLSVNAKTYQGKFLADSSRMAFSKIKPALDKATPAFEKNLIQVLKKTDRWAFARRMLLLYRQEKVVARFIKMD